MTRLPLELHPEAEAEARDARFWYAQRDAAAAERFMRALDHAMQMIVQAPERWPSYLHGARRFLTRRYPFSVVYRVLADRILVVAVAHQRRRPGYWRSR